MSTLKTLENDASAADFINSFENETKRADGLKLLELYTEVTGLQPRMWGESIIGFDKYHYKSERSAQEGDWPLAAFSPRKQNLTLYIMPGFNDYADLLARLGPHKVSVGCLYLKKLTDVDINVLRELIKKAYIDAKAQYGSLLSDS